MNNLSKKLVLIILGAGLSYGCGQQSSDLNLTSEPGVKSSSQASTDENSLPVNDGNSHESGGTPVSLQDIPSLRASNYDYSSATFASSQVVKQKSGIFSRTLSASAARFSRGACEAETAKRQIFTDTAGVDTFMCYVKTVNRDKSEMTVPADQWAYYESDMDVYGNGSPIAMRVRLGSFNGELRLDVCSAPLGEFRHALELRLKQNEDGYQGHAIRASYAQNGGEAQISRMDFTMQGKVGDRFDWMNVAHQHMGIDIDGKSHTMNTLFDANETQHTNILSANITKHAMETGDYNLNITSQWGADKIGSVKYAIASDQTVSTTEQCIAWGVPEEKLSECVNTCFDQGQGSDVSPDSNGRCIVDFARSESFKIKDLFGQRFFTKVSDDTSAFFEAINAETYLGKLTEQTSFENSWNCEAPQAFTYIETSEIDLVGECGATSTLPRFQSCENEIWESYLNIVD